MTSSTKEPISLPPQPSDETIQEESTITIRQSTLYYFAIAIVFFIAGFIVAWVTFSTTSAATSADALSSAASAGARDAVRAEMSALQGTMVASVMSAAGGGPAATPTPIQPINIEIGNSPAWGPENAAVTIVEFSDFQCTFCERFFKETYPQIKQNYGDKVRFVFKHFPISFIHPDAERASMAAECANEQGKFWEYHDILFQNQADLSRDALVRYAGQIAGKNVSQFTQCLDTQKYAATVQADLTYGEGIGVNGTPTFFINGLPLVGAQPYRAFDFAIQQALRAAQNK